MNEEKNIIGLLLEFEDADPLMTAVGKVRDEGFKKWDVHTPCPLHGLDEAMGIKPTILPYIVLVAGIIGAAVGLGMQWWTNAVDYPLIISGKPLFSLPANIPIIFETTVLFSAVTAVFSLIALNGLPQWYNPLFKNEKFLRATSDRFFIFVDAKDPKFRLEETKQFLSSLGGTSLEMVED